MKNMSKNLENGFTLIELIIVLAIIGVIMALVGPRIVDQFEKSKAVSAQVQLKSIDSALTSMRLDIGRYPTQAEGLRLLQVPNADVAEQWQGPYLASDLPEDPWGQAYLYKAPALLGERPTLGSLGSDGQPGGSGAAKDIFLGEARADPRP